MTTLKIGDRVVDIWYGATGTVFGVPPTSPDTDPLYDDDTEPWVQVVWDYTGNKPAWAREADLKALNLSS